MLTQNMLVPASVKAASEAGIKSAILFHGYRCVSPSFFYQEDALKSYIPSFFKVSFKDKLKWPLIGKTLKMYKQAYSEASMTIANSKYSANVLERFFGIKPATLYPILDMKLCEKEVDKSSDGAILFVKPQKIKGVEILFSVAKKIKEKKFIVVGNANRSIQSKLSKHPNIEYRSWVDDMDSVYKECSALFGPSQIPEPFGRVFLEAGMRGIPTVASNWGGIPDAVGGGGILLEFNSSVDEWAGAILELLSKEKYSHLSVEARKNAEAVFSNHTPQYLQKILEKI
jgi:glycosyltransferase involved in cell wall biosynthesis